MPDVLLRTCTRRATPSLLVILSEGGLTMNHLQPNRAPNQSEAKTALLGLAVWHRPTPTAQLVPDEALLTNHHIPLNR